MPEYQMDTSGYVVQPASYGTFGKEWCDLDPFTQGYIEALFFTSEEEFVETAECEAKHGNGWLAAGFGFSDLAPDTLTAIIANCAKFQADNRADLDEALDQGRIQGYDDAAAGRDFWYSRNGHGVGYFDRDALASGIGDKLQDLANRQGSVDCYLGDDGRVYLS